MLLLGTIWREKAKPFDPESDRIKSQMRNKVFNSEDINRLAAFEQLNERLIRKYKKQISSNVAA